MCLFVMSFFHIHGGINMKFFSIIYITIKNYEVNVTSYIN